MSTFVISHCTEELKAALAAIATVNGETIEVREAAIIKASPALAGILKKLLSRLIVSQETEKTVNVQKVAANVVMPTGTRVILAPRVCEACGETYQPVRKDQKYCPCKKTRKAEEATAETDPLALTNRMRFDQHLENQPQAMEPRI